MKVRWKVDEVERVWFVKEEKQRCLLSVPASLLPHLLYPRLAPGVWKISVPFYSEHYTLCLRRREKSRGLRVTNLSTRAGSTTLCGGPRQWSIGRLKPLLRGYGRGCR